MLASALINPTMWVLSGGIRVNEKAGIGADDCGSGQADRVLIPVRTFPRPVQIME